MKFVKIFVAILKIIPFLEFLVFSFLAKCFLQKYLLTFFNQILVHCSTSIPPENIRKPEGFFTISGGYKNGTSCQNGLSSNLSLALFIAKMTLIFD